MRRRPLLERIQTYLDPGDFLLWLSEELNDDTHEDFLNSWAIPIGIVLNFLFILARGSSSPGDSRGSDDVFGDIDGKRGSGWFAWLVSISEHVSLCGDWNQADGNCTGDLPRAHFDDRVLPQHLLHFLPQATLPPFRATCRSSAQYTVGTACAC